MAAISEEVSGQIRAAEERLRRAMLESDVAVLDELIADDLLFTNHLGQILGKQNDLDMHASGQLRFSRLDASELRVLQIGGLPVTSVCLTLAGHLSEQPFAAELRFTRVWRRAEAGQWQLAVVHSSVMQPF